MYDGRSDTQWFTLPGQGEDAWIDIQFQNSLRISKIAIQQAGVIPGSTRTTRFEQFSIISSSGSCHIMTLGSASDQWNVIYFEPPIDETGLRFVALKYSYDSFDNLQYGIKAISIYGSAGNYG